LKKNDLKLNIRIRALFLDFDGTISPINVRTSEATVVAETRAVLDKIGQHIPIAVITTKSLPFVVERTPFAQAWSALGGLEIRIGNVVVKAQCLQDAKNVMDALEYSKNVGDDVLSIEEKCDSEGNVVAFSVDWRYSKNPEKAKGAASRIAAYCKTLPLFTLRYENQPFFDVFPCQVNKGEALLLLKKQLGLHDGIIYMGDSVLDNPAFESADVAIGVLHKETPACLSCDCFVKFENVTDFLSGLLKNKLVFNTDLPYVFCEEK
jgi:trehalose-phosphatase